MIINVIPKALPAAMNPQLTWHARKRMHSLGFTIRDVANAITEPRWTRPNGPGHPADCMVSVGQDLLVVWNPRTREVLTVLLRTDEPYEHGVHHRLQLPTAA